MEMKNRYLFNTLTKIYRKIKFNYEETLVTLAKDDA